MKKKIIIVAMSLAVLAGLGVLVFYPEDTASLSDPGNTRQVDIGKVIYADYCAACHGVDLEGETPEWRSMKEDGTLPAPPHDDSGHTWHHGDRLLFDYIHDGGQAIVPEGFKSGMPAFGDDLEDNEIWAVLAFIKSRWSAKNVIRQQQMTQRERS